MAWQLYIFSYDEGMRWQLMCVLDGSCGKVQKKLRLCIVEKSDFAVDCRVNGHVSNALSSSTRQAEGRQSSTACFDVPSKAISVQVRRPSDCCAHSCDFPDPRSLRRRKMVGARKVQKVVSKAATGCGASLGRMQNGPAEAFTHPSKVKMAAPVCWTNCRVCS